MTLANVIADGRGTLDYMLDVEGWPDLWVTTAQLAGTQSDSRVRRNGLKRQGLGFGERGRVAEGRLEFNGCTVSIVDVGLGATVSFTTEQTKRMWLTASVSDSDTVWTVSNTDFLIGDGTEYYHCGTETVRIASIADSTHMTVERAKWGTIARAHTLGYGDRLQFPQIADRPTILVGRRAKLYAFGAEELAQGVSATGTLVMRGLVNSQPRSTGGKLLTYSFGLDHIGKVLDQTLGANLDKGVKIRGIYYAYNAPLVILITEKSTTDVGGGIAHQAYVALAGFWESQSDFVAALNTAISTATTAGGFTQQVTAVIDGVQGWRIDVRTNGSPKAVTFNLGSVVDGDFIPDGLIDSTGALVTTVSASSTYTAPWGFNPGPDGAAFKSAAAAVPRAVPRAQYGAGTRTRFGGLSTDPTANPATRLFLDRSDLVNVGDLINEGNYTVTGKDQGGTVGSIDVDLPLANGRGTLAFAGVDGQWDLMPLTRLASGTVADFVSGLWAVATASVPGTVPLITTNDLSVSAATVSAALGGMGGDAFLRRLYQFRRSQTLADVLAAEFLWYGLVPYVTATGIVSARVIKLATPTDAATSLHSLFVGDGFGQTDQGAEGSFGAVAVSIGYDATDDSFADITTERNVRAIEALGTSKAIAIAPRIPTLNNAMPGVEDIVSMASPLLTLFGERYTVLTVPVTLREFNTLLYDTVLVTAPQIPYAGARGLTNKPAIVIGREWDLDALRGNLTLLVSSLNVLGYAPTARISAKVNTSGNIWDLTIDRSYYFPDATAACSVHFSVGDTVRASEWDNAAPSTQTGTVTDFPAADKITVSFDGAWAGTLPSNLSLRERASATAHMKLYVYIADSSGAFSDGVYPAVFGG